uniref:Adenosylhomocysteine nucleosidase n=1 Tax=Opuntia streptacantha TaxID=393608 RepID=A0A7C9DG16_OPUST
MAGPMVGLKLVALVLGLLVMVPKTMQRNVDDPLYGLLQRLNDNEGPFLGIILPESDRDEELFKNSGYFEARKDNSSLMFAGRQFNIGKFRGMSAVYVRAGEPLANVGATVQLLIEKFRLIGIISYGTSGSTSDKLDVPNVAVPTYVAYASAWKWQEWEPSVEVHGKARPSLKIGDYNVPKPGENKLGSIQYEKVRKYTPKGSKRETFWFYIYPEWVDIANEIEASELDRCIGGTTCNEQLPEIVKGLRIASSDSYISNSAYANFLRDHLDVAAVDTDSAGVVSVAVANGMPHIVFKAASNRPGVPQDPKLSALARENVLKVVAAFVDRLSQKMQPQPRISIY